MDAWGPLLRALDDLPRASLALPAGGRLGAALVLFADADGDGDLEIVYTRRREDLPTHPGQVSFPGGRVERGETVEQAAVREASEEVGLDPGSAQVLGRLPAFYIAPSRFWLQPVVARWIAPHDLVAQEAEVAEVLRVRLSTLRDPAVWRVVRLPPTGRAWAWQLDERHLLWGATAGVTAALLDMIEPDWHRGVELSGLPADREVRPWEAPSTVSPARGPARLPGVTERPIAEVGHRVISGLSPAPQTLAVAGQAIAEAVVRMGSRTGQASILVLAGGGGNAAAGLHAAQRLREVGREVHVVLDRPPGRLGALTADALRGVADVARVYGGALPEAGVVVDALVGGGLSGPLTGTARDLVLALRHHVSPVVAVDVPTGLHPTDGLVGECLPADVTVTLGAPPRGLLLPGLGPFVGDLYLAALDGEGVLARLVPDVAVPRRYA